MSINIKGLTAKEVEQRINSGQVNGEGNVPTKSVKQILRTNLLTFFNLLNLCLAIAVFTVGSPKNALFIGVIICNTGIGVVQEIRAKRIIDKLSLISAPRVHVVRDGKETEIAVSDIVLDDVMRLSAGMQVCADSIIINGECEVNESLVTGESDPQPKKANTENNQANKDNELLSGSFVICGEAYARVTGVGADNFANKITSGAKYLKKPNSEMLGSIDKIIKIITICIVPISLILFCKAIFITGEPLDSAVTSAVAAILGMIPQGLVLLVSMVLAVSGIRLSRHNTLVQDLYCIETLARVDVLCLDKTGTITEGRMQVEEIVPLADDLNENEVYSALGAITHVLPDDNPTANAVREKYGKYYNEDWKSITDYPFSSARKWSGVRFGNGIGSYIMGAAEFMLSQEQIEKIKSKCENYSNNGKRVVLLARSDNDFGADKNLPADITPVALVIISDLIRAEAPDTLKYFADQNVEIKIISGDNPITIKIVATEAGVKNAENFIDMSEVRDEEIAETVKNYTVFGRVTPSQKLALVKALKSQGHIVGMTGDGVNDVLALKEADCSIAMQSGSDAARNVSSLVLMDSNFASMPRVVAEGRRSINNIERSASLFLSKTTYSFLLAVIFLFVQKPYPFIPIQMTLISSLFIGIPSFLLAMERNESLVKGSFIHNVLKKALPFGICCALNIVFVIIWGYIIMNISSDDIRTLSTLVLGVTSFVSLCYLCKPLNKKRTAMLAALAVVFTSAFFGFQEFFSITEFTPNMIVFAFALSGASINLIRGFLKDAEKIGKKKSKS